MVKLECAVLIGINMESSASSTIESCIYDISCQQKECMLEWAQLFVVKSVVNIRQLQYPVKWDTLDV